MRTTLNLEDQLVREAKLVALRRRTTLSRLIEEALRQTIGAETASEAAAIDLPVSSGPPLPPDFPWHSGTLMFDYVERLDAPP
jgi:hypothetical protein